MFNLFSFIIFVTRLENNKIVLTRQINSDTHQYAATFKITSYLCKHIKIGNEYEQEIPQLQTADNPMAPPGRAPQPSRDTRKTNQAKQPTLSSQSR